MFTQESIAKQFGEWCNAFWPGLRPLLDVYKDCQCLVSIVKSPKRSDEVTCTIKLKQEDQASVGLAQATVQQLQATAPAFKQMCVDVTCEVTRRNNQWHLKLEFHLIDAHQLTSAERQRRHQMHTWKPCQKLVRALTASCASQFAKFLQGSSQLSMESMHRVAELLKLYCVSSDKTPPPKLVIVPSQPNTLIFANVRHTSAGWWTHVTQQMHLGVSSVELKNNELHLHMDPPLEFTELRPHGRHHRTNVSLFRRIKQSLPSVWPW